MGTRYQVMATSRDIFALPGELSRAILAITGANVGNLVLNKMALVGRLWHNALAPQAGACMQTLTRRVTLGERDMLGIAQIARSWWRWVRGRKDVTDTGLASLAAGCRAITTLDLSECSQITDTGLASLTAGCSAITTLYLGDCKQITDTGLASLAAGCTSITTLDLMGLLVMTDTWLASLAARTQGCSAIYTLHHIDYYQITDTGLDGWAVRTQGYQLKSRYQREIDASR